MSVIKFLTSKTFLKQLVLAVVAVVVFCFLMLKYLNFSTNHGDFETVPELKGKSINVAQIELEDNNLVMKIQDSANYNPDYPKFSVIEQEPLAGTQVKENRKIYITLNPSGYRKMNIPDGLIDRTYRQVKPTLEALGFKVGRITYADNIGKDMVLKLSHKGKTLNPGDKLARTSEIDLVLGNGKRP
ncbi:PASTA domain-containing protein [Algibacter luteus]|jgi:beta-lactam-binding protein with PASTA domain|uniref:PASTA domain-containing protein n=1 Tax=Algibacter luteus TaxID=1178825 RepID=A0A1M6H8C0_9FLAO|nr:PASTA domain-containing protein [Algibacter luteus]WJJ96130.1 PASTA domain-containing protein [Algibacter luteus]SHJ18437.1 PASTA domain-containing protein [Algibacter luteus]